MFYCERELFPNPPKDDVEADDDADEVTEDVFDQDQDNQIVEANNQEDPQTDETQSKRTKTVSVSSNNQRQAENVHEFSLYQSNVLYALFLLGFASSIGFDVAVQVARKWDKVRDKWYVVAISTKIALSVLALNTLLWLDFVREFLRTRKNPISQTNQTLGWIQELINFTTNSLICCFLIPILAIRRYQTHQPKKQIQNIFSEFSDTVRLEFMIHQHLQLLPKLKILEIDKSLILNLSDVFQSFIMCCFIFVSSLLSKSSIFSKRNTIFQCH